MTSLIAVLSSGKGTWAHVSSLIKLGTWDKIFLICSKFAYDNFSVDQNDVTKLIFDEKDINKSIDALSNFFKKEINDLEVGINLVSGAGIEHMAILSSVLKSGLGIRFVYVKDDEVCEFKIFDQKFETVGDF